MQNILSIVTNTFKEDIMFPFFEGDISLKAIVWHHLELSHIWVLSHYAVLVPLSPHLIIIIDSDNYGASKSITFTMKNTYPLLCDILTSVCYSLHQNIHKTPLSLLTLRPHSMTSPKEQKKWRKEKQKSNKLLEFLNTSNAQGKLRN